MSHYATDILPPSSFTQREQHALSNATGAHRDGLRDHTLFAVALGTALREHEIIALDCGDVFDASGTPRHILVLRVFKGCRGRAKAREVRLPKRLRLKLAHYRRWKSLNSEPVDADTPLFLSQKGNRLSTRQLRRLAHEWQERAGLDRHLNFHALRHTAISNFQRACGNIRATQLFAGHSRVTTTERYEHASTEQLEHFGDQIFC